MKKNTWDIIIDAASFAALMATISTGLLLKFVLTPGSGRIEIISRGGHRMINVFFGLTRHEWGQIHFYIAAVFVVLLIAHLILHWSWIKATIFDVKGGPESWKRKIIAIGILFIIIFAVLFPWIGSKKAYTRSEFLEIRGFDVPNK